MYHLYSLDENGKWQQERTYPRMTAVIDDYGEEYVRPIGGGHTNVWSVHEDERDDSNTIHILIMR